MTKKKIEKVLELMANFEVIAAMVLNENEWHGRQSIDASKNSGALRRRSMDLTRALAELRKS